MKAGKNLQELAAEITRQHNAKRDFLISTDKVNAFIHDGHLELGFPIKENESELFTAALTKPGHTQLAEFCNIPVKYYDIMQAHPELLQVNVQHWLKNFGKKRMIRSLDGKVRAILSDRYRRLDNFELANNVLPMLIEAGAEVESCDITETRLYIKAVTHKVQAEIKTGDVVSSGIIVSNSETGHGSLSIKPLVYRLVCSNGAIVDDYATKKYHVGRANELDQIEFSNETLHADDKAFWLKTRDLVKHTLNETTFDKIVDVMRASTDKKFASVDKAIELTTKQFSFTDTEKTNILEHLVAGGDTTSWGLGNAVTRMAQDVDSYDRSTELESIGFKIMRQSWN